MEVTAIKQQCSIARPSETFTAKRDHSLTYRTNAYRGENEADLVLTIKISSSTDKSILTIAGHVVEFNLTHKSVSSRWDLVHNDCIVCTARKISTLRTKYILEELEQMYFSPIPLNTHDKYAAKHEAERLFMTVTRKSTMSYTFVLHKKKADPISPVFFAFLYAMFFNDFKRNEAFSAFVAGAVIYWNSL